MSDRTSPFDHSQARAWRYLDADTGVAVTVTIPVDEYTLCDPSVGIDAMRRAAERLSREAESLDHTEWAWHGENADEVREVDVPTDHTIAPARAPKMTVEEYIEARRREAAAPARTDKQVGRLKKAAREHGLSHSQVRDLAIRLFGTPSTALNRRQTSELIEHVEGVADDPSKQW